MKNRINSLFDQKESILSIYYTAGFPDLSDTVRIAASLEKSGVDMLEVGIPFSDPVADGPTIQDSSKQALDNGMTLPILFDQLKELRATVQIPVLLMGYINPILQFGIGAFCDKCAEVGVDGVIVPDLPLQEFEEKYAQIFKEKNIVNVFLISPSTSPERIRMIDEQSKGFVYMVSSASVTGAKSSVGDEQIAYFERINSMGLRSPKVIGFGISNQETFSKACEYSQGAIIGSAFVKALGINSSNQAIQDFIHSIKKQ